MKTLHRRALGLVLTAGLAVTTAGCDDFLDVTNTGSLEKESINAERDAELLSQSVYQQFISSSGDLPVYSAWYTGTAWVGDTFPTRNDFGRREIPNNNGHINSTSSNTPGFWHIFGENIQFARSTADAIAEAGPTVGLARSWFVSGYSILMLAETFCEGTIAESTLVPGNRLSTAQLLDSAITDLQKARQTANAVGTDAATSIANAAQVGIARAHLQAGRKSEASAAASQVPEDFVFELWHLDDPSNRALGNSVFSFSESRISLVVPPEFRAIADAGDPRVSYTDMGRVAQDGVLTFYRQDKYEGFGDNERFASGLEARYIIAEAAGPTAATEAFVNERRAVGGLGPMDASATDNQVMTELLRQKAIDFWLEDTKRMGDFRRVPQYMSYIIPAGETTYYKPDLGPVRGETCWPVPRNEIENNPNFN